MGGEAFTSGPNALFTPRMPKSVYLHVKKLYREILLQYFNSVTTPIEAPEKTDYGDVDYVVSIPKDIYKGPECLMKALGAVQIRRGPTNSFAVPWPESLDDDLVDETTPNATKDTHSLESEHLNGQHSSKFVQVDISINNTGNESYAWEVFHKSHGDLWNILGSTIRKYGLTVNHNGLYLRIEDIELVDRKKSRILLSTDPNIVLEFLALDQKTYSQPFATVQEMFEYAAQCRLFWVRKTEEDAEEERDTDKKALKHNDRQRMRKRPLFRRWIEEFFPECRRQGKFLEQPSSRDEVLREVFIRFPEVKAQYNERLETFIKARQADEVWREVIKAGVPETEDLQLRSAAVKSLKAIIMADDYSLGIIPSKTLKQDNGHFNVEEVAEFVKFNWRRVGELQIAATKAHAAGTTMKTLKRIQDENTANEEQNETTQKTVYREPDEKERKGKGGNKVID